MTTAQTMKSPVGDDLIDAAAFAGCAPETLEKAGGSDLPAMISGGAGRAKEVIARALHSCSPRSRGPFVTLNLGLVPADSLEIELFGHEDLRVANLQDMSSGALKRARGGTLFLDEIGELSLAAQSRLLRFLQAGSNERLKNRSESVRLISASRKDIFSLAEEGRFLKELFFEMSVIPFRIPPLSSHANDVDRLLNFFFASAAGEGLPRKDIEPGAIDCLRRHHWPGDLRELESVAWRLVALYPETLITPQIVEQELSSAKAIDANQVIAVAGASGFRQIVSQYLASLFHECDPALPADGLYWRILEDLEQPLISAALSATRGNQIRAAKLLGLNRNTLRRKVRDLDHITIRWTR
ncbi:MAG: sigma 54-interacting transcriptional regulator [Pseudomonadota bacterium]